MAYIGGEEVRLNYKVSLSNGATGVVVCSIDTNEYTLDFSRENWEYLEKGFLVNFPDYGLIHYKIPEDGMIIVGRGALI